MTRPAPAPSRIVIEDVSPQIDQGRLPVKRVVGEPVQVGATVFADGHDRLHVVVSHRPPRAPDDATGGRRSASRIEVPMSSVNPGLDRWEAGFVPTATGQHRFEVRAWIDHVATWRDATRRKIEAAVHTPGDLLTGAALLEGLADLGPKREAKALRAAAAALTEGDPTVVTDDEAGRAIEAVAHVALRRTDAASSDELTVAVEGERALFSAWYELFPRSIVSSASTRPGTLRDAVGRLSDIAEMGFDVVYLPPIHPIGTAFRKGPDNTTQAGPDDPGSPWAIGGPEGGHTAVHPDLGTVDDVVELAAAARALGMDLALDLAFQCSPDHPWVTEHPGWFRHRPDGTIQYAENPPKKYQDIYPLDFESADWRSLWDALLEVTLFWADRGVRVFRVDNPHTKPFPFWQWLIAEVEVRHPGTVFLAEAFTRPAIMARLGRVGFTQGYTYFTWRTSKHELIEYFSELASAPSADGFRPNAWPTTPDILPGNLQHAPLAAFALRVALAATLSPSYGVFGPSFELGENVPFDLPDGSTREELARSEKYEVRRWDLEGAPTIRPLLTDLNRIRNGQLALHTLRTLRFHGTDNDALICYSKTAHAGPSVDASEPDAASVLVVVNLDPFGTQGAMVDLDLYALGIDPERPFEVEDLLGGATYTWSGSRAYVELDPDRHPAHVFRVSQGSESRDWRMIDDADDPLWYKDAVIYELHVRAFGDSDGDGVGDFQGLTDRLDYLQQLGITAIWLLPFYPSPLRDDGYDIADYANVNPAYGTLRDFKAFLREAHRRGLRVITELVLNHTSDQHPWFQRARQAKPGSRWRDFYVWSDSPERYSEARVIFEDYETSNWTWDPVAGAYYWHRFFAHQPDLNFDSPDVRSTMLRMVDQWLRMGVDGVRLDAVPYLFEREGTNCENLPETHEFLRELRAHVDTNFPGRMLLGEANQWPEDSAAYFGADGGDECHMAFHFPLMPRLFMSLRMEDRFPVIDILQQTPDIPATAQWAIFLRNHDELTLEMVTDEERDYMYHAYAADPQMRVNVGIRRRLAPLLQNDRRKIELMNGLLFALPGTPVIYYGDELGMGDNVYLGDRDAVRTPMQWSRDRNAGFSSANPQQLYLPTIIDPEYHHETVNVEAQQQNPSSLLSWMRRIIALRAQHNVFGRGDIEFLLPENAKVLAFTRRLDDEIVLVVANLSRFSQSVTLDLHDHRGMVPVELFGGNEFTPIVEGGYNLTLGPYGFYWFSLQPQHHDALGQAPAPEDLPVISVPEDWRQLFRGRSRGRAALARAWPDFFLRNRWYAGRTRTIRHVEVIDTVPVAAGRGRPAAFVALVQVEYADGEPETYIVPLTVATGPHAEQVASDHPNSVIAWIDVAKWGERLLLFDATADDEFLDSTIQQFKRNRTYDSNGGAEMRTSTTPALRRILSNGTDLSVARTSVEQSNTSAVFGNQTVLKIFRRAQEGVNPDLEIGRFLTERGFEHSADLVGTIEYQKGRGEPRTLGVLNTYVPNEGDAWHYTLDALGLFYESAIHLLPDDALAVPEWAGLLDAVDVAVPDLAADAIGPYLDSAEMLGRRTAELHQVLALGDTEEFEPEPFTSLYQRSLYQSMRTQVRPTLSLVRRMIDDLEGDGRLDAQYVLDHEADLLAAYDAVRQHRIDASRIRIHGDYHLGQVLHTGRDFVIIDFEGEPSRSPTERRIKRGALTDVAGIVRSFQYAAEAGLRDHHARGLVPPDQAEALEARGRVWQTWVTVRFLAGYLAEADGHPFVPSDPADTHALLTAYVLDKALYEVRYDLGHRPDWAPIPLRGVASMLQSLHA